MKALWPYSDGTCWDQGLVAELVAGKLWPGGLKLERVRPDQPDWDALHHEDGAVLVLHGEVTSRDGYLPVVRRLVESLPWCLVIHASDERLTLDSGVLRGPRTKTWLQMVDPKGRVHHDRPVLLGWRAETCAILAGLPSIPSGERRLWSFAGQCQNDWRRNCVAQVEGRTDGDLLVTGGFGQGRNLEEHLQILSTSAIALCPSGNTVDCQRPYEALEAGCLPIADRRGPSWPRGDGGYWRTVLGCEPFPCVDDWRELPALLDLYASDQVKLQRDANKAGAWWLRYKRKLTHDLADDVAQLSGRAATRSPVTVLMPTSSIAAHPSTDLIEDAIRRTRSYPELADAEIIVMVDGLHERHAERAWAYEEYKRRLIRLCATSLRGVLPLVFDEHTHQAGMTRQALKLVRTPLVLFQEHDTWPVWDIDWSGLFRAMDQPNVNVVTLHTDASVIQEHRYLLCGEVESVAGVPLVRHQKWSQRPHLARADWYRQVIDEYFGPDAKTMIEDVLWGACHTRVAHGIDPWERWGLWMYHPADPKHGILRSATCDGRGKDPKVPLVITYPGPTPTGAPQPGVMKW